MATKPMASCSPLRCCISRQIPRGTGTRTFSLGPRVISRPESSVLASKSRSLIRLIPSSRTLKASPSTALRPITTSQSPKRMFSCCSASIQLGLLLGLVTLFSASVQAFAPRGFLKREDPAAPKGAPVEEVKEQKRFDLDGFYPAPQQMKRFEVPEAFYEQALSHYPQQKRFDYLDGFYGGAPAASGFYPFAPTKRFDFGYGPYGPRGRTLSAFL